MNTGKALRTAIIIVAIIFVIHQFFSSFYQPITTETAVFDNGTEGIDITALLLRNETIVTNSDNGVLHFSVEDGTRVAKNGVIAGIYDSESASITVNQIENIKRQISDFEDIIAYNNLDATDLDIVNNKLNSAVYDFVIMCSAGDYSNLDTAKQELLSIINRKQMIIGTTTDFTPQLESLKGQLNSLNASLPALKGSVKAQMSGYFLSTIDGFENCVDIKNLKSITPENFDSIKPTDKQKNAIGKIVSDYEWYIVTKISINDSLNYKVGDTVKISTTIKTAPILTAKVSNINVSESGENAVIIFSCSQMSSEIAQIRTAPMTIIKTEYNGLRVSKRALRVSDSKTGVYVVSGMQIKFVPVTVTYSNENYIICKQENSNSNVLRLYDEVVVKGRNLYDGKIIS